MKVTALKHPDHPGPLTHAGRSWLERTRRNSMASRCVRGCCCPRISEVFTNQLLYPSRLHSSDYKTPSCSQWSPEDPSPETLFAMPAHLGCVKAIPHTVPNPQLKFWDQISRSGSPSIEIPLVWDLSSRAATARERHWQFFVLALLRTKTPRTPLLFSAASAPAGFCPAALSRDRSLSHIVCVRRRWRRPVNTS